MNRQVDFKIAVVAAGETLLTQLRDIRAGSVVNIKGFMNKSVFRGQEIKLVLHAESITKE
jgi:primosomal replication protein N